MTVEEAQKIVWALKPRLSDLEQTAIYTLAQAWAEAAFAAGRLDAHPNPFAEGTSSGHSDSEG